MILKRGSRDDYVICLQNGLTLMCIDPGDHDGIFGENTENAVIEFQKRFGLNADGIVGPDTWNKLKANGMVDKNTWKILRTTSSSSHNINKSRLLAKFNKRKFFNSIYVNLNGFDIAK